MDETQPISLTPEIKDSWNKFQDHLGGDYPTSQALNEFNGKNPKSQLEESHIPAALNYIKDLKTNPNIEGLTPAYKNGSNMRFPVTADGNHVDLGEDPKNRIPAPNYADPTSRLNYAKQFAKKYGIQGRGDTPLRLNETPDEGTDTAKNLTIKAAQPFGLDPTLLYSSSMEEGMSGLFKNKQGESDFSGDKNYPTNGFYSFGLDDFSDMAPKLIKKGYLSPEFKNQYVPHQYVNEQGRTVNSAHFKNPDAALQAKAAVVKDFQDQTEAYANKQGIPLSDKAKQFFTLVAYNGGAGTMQKMLAEYKKRGLLEGDKYLNEQPNNPNLRAAHEHTVIRMKMANALKSEGLF